MGDRPKFKICVLVVFGVGLLCCSLFLCIVVGGFLFGGKAEEGPRGSAEPFQIEDFSINLKIMPSQNTKMNMMRLPLASKSLIKSKKLPPYGKGYYFNDNTTLYFPKIKFLADEVPVGDSEPYCVHLFWVQKEHEMTLELYESVKGFPQCQKALNPKIIWHQHDPITGAEVHTWLQSMTYLKGCNDKVSCQKKCDRLGGIAKRVKTGDYVCYSYKILNEICLVVDFNSTTSWTYHGGCYENGSPFKMVDAVPGHTYAFDDVKILVRLLGDTQIEAFGSSPISTFSYCILILGVILLLLGIVCVLFKEPILNSNLGGSVFKDPPILQSMDLQLS